MTKQGLFDYLIGDPYADTTYAVVNQKWDGSQSFPQLGSMHIPSYMPGQAEMIADQIYAGYGQGSPGGGEYDYQRPPAPEAPAPAPTPAEPEGEWQFGNWVVQTGTGPRGTAKVYRPATSTTPGAVFREFPGGFSNVKGDAMDSILEKKKKNPDNWRFVKKV